MRHTRAGVRTTHVCGIAVLVVSLVASSGAQVPSRPFGLPNVPRESAPTAGMLLVASRELRDPNFVETVIVLTGYGAEGAVGLILNRRTTVPLARVFPSLTTTTSAPGVVFQGGPVEVTTAQALRRGRRSSGPGVRISDDLHFIGTPDALEAQFAESTSQSVVRVFLGYAGWSAGQLDAEVAAGAWHVFPSDTTVVFDDAPDTLWMRQIRRTAWRSAGLQGTGYGLRAAGCGLQATGYGLRAAGDGQRSTVDGPRVTRAMGTGYGLQATGCRLRSTAAVSGQRSAVDGQRSTVSGRRASRVTCVTLRAPQYTLRNKIYCGILPPWRWTTIGPMGARGLSES